MTSSTKGMCTYPGCCRLAVDSVFCQWHYDKEAESLQEAGHAIMREKDCSQPQSIAKLTPSEFNHVIASLAKAIPSGDEEAREAFYVIYRRAELLCTDVDAIYDPVIFGLLE